jgi:hypothetical protein
LLASHGSAFPAIQSTEVGGPDRVLSVSSEIAINSAIVQSTASLTVDSTEETVDSDIISVDAG